MSNEQPLPDATTTDWLADYVREIARGIVHEVVEALKNNPDVLLQLAGQAGTGKAPSPSLNHWLTTQQAADHLGMSVRTVRQAAKEGRLPAHKNPANNGVGEWRFNRLALDKWMRKKSAPRKSKEVSVYK